MTYILTLFNGNAICSQETMKQTYAIGILVFRVLLRVLFNGDAISRQQIMKQIYAIGILDFRVLLR